MDNQALRPDAPSFQLATELDEEVLATPAESEAIKEELELASLVDHPGWHRFTAEVERQIEGLRTMKTASLEGKSMEEVGKMFLVSSLAADKLQTALEVVEQTARQVDMNREKRR